MSVQAYAERKRQLIDSSNGVWQIAPPREEHIRELLSEPVGVAAAAGSHPGFKDHGGSHIANPRLVIIDCGPFWNDVTKRNQFAKEVMEFGYLSGLTAYGSGNGTFWGAITGPTLSGSVTDAQLQGVLRQLIAGGQVPQPDSHTLYALSLPDGVTVSDGQDSSCSAFCGYHSALDSQTFYSVHPSTLCDGCHGGLEPFVGYCMVLAHEIAEACTDAVPGQGWYVDDANDSMNGSENADLEAWIPLQWGPWTVQGYYTIEAGNTVGAYLPPVQPQPQPQASKLVISVPQQVQVNQDVQVTVLAQDAQSDNVAGYNSQVRLTSSDQTATLPAAYTFTVGDGGKHTFTVRFGTAGGQMLAAGDGSLQASAITTVSALPQDGYTFVDPLIKWIMQNFGGHFFDAIEAMDANPADKPTYESWRAACKQRGLI